MTNEELQDSLYWNLLQVSVRAKHSLIQLAETHDLAIMQLYTLCTLEDSKPSPMNTISCVLGCDASNVTGIIDRLFKQGYIERQENPQDRRVKMIALTEKGKELKYTLLSKIQQHSSTALGNLNADQKRQLQELVHIALQPPKTAGK
ncbi:MAG TPA: MarR family transcriptional regulator [Candidatus Saccharimonadales bacterium]|nr:MarR family transcriptional regulator [Candidatus Saccharimonadales bacterium]